MSSKATLKGASLRLKVDTSFSNASSNARITWSSEGGTRQVGGVPGLIGNQPYSLTAVARSGAEVSFVARDDFNSIVQTEQSLMLKVLQVLAAEVRSARLALAQI